MDNSDDRRRWIIPTPVRYDRRRQVLYSDANRTAPKLIERDAELQILEVFIHLFIYETELLVRVSGARDVNEVWST